MSHYQRHVFFCCNQRDGGQVCCNNNGASGMRDYAKRRVKELGMAGAGKVRVNIAGCLDRCELGPTMVIYPEGVWYSYRSQQDIEEILHTHVIGGGRVGRLMLQPNEGDSGKA